MNVLIVFAWCNTFVMLLFQQLPNLVGSKMNAFEKRLENVTTTLNNLHNSLEEVSTATTVLGAQVRMINFLSKQGIKVSYVDVRLEGRAYYK